MPSKALPTGQTRPLRAYFVIALAIVATSSAAILIRYALDESMPPVLIVAARLLIATVALTPLILKRYLPKIRRLSRTERLLIGLSGICLALHFTAWVSSLQYTSVFGERGGRVYRPDLGSDFGSHLFAHSAIAFGRHWLARRFRRRAADWLAFDRGRSGRSSPRRGRFGGDAQGRFSGLARRAQRFGLYAHRAQAAPDLAGDTVCLAGLWHRDALRGCRYPHHSQSSGWLPPAGLFDSASDGLGAATAGAFIAELSAGVFPPPLWSACSRS